MRILLLGPLRVVDDDDREIDLAGMRLRALLTRLALEPGGVVGLRTLREDLWPEQEPENPGAALHSLVSRLRRALPADVVGSVPTGYRLDLAAEEVDAVRFERLVAEGRRAVRAGSCAVAIERLDRALELWRAEPLVEFTDLRFAQETATRLAGLRLDAIEDRIEAGLSRGEDPLASPVTGSPVTGSPVTGSPATASSATTSAPGTAGGAVDVVADLRELVARHPLRERLRSLLIKSLESGGRRAEALAAYEEYRAYVADRLGADPGTELQQLHLELLRAENVREQQWGNLPLPLTSFVGREAERDRIAERLRDTRLVTLVGPGGVGKTRLANEVAGGRSTGGERAWRAWMVDLSAVAESEDVPRAAAAALGLRASADALARLAEALTGLGSMVLLDGCEHVLDGAASLAEDLLGRCADLRVLATSREPLGITSEALCPVAPLGSRAALRLLTERATAVWPGMDPVLAEPICERLDGLPLAIELAAARLRSMPAEVLAERLGTRPQALPDDGAYEPSGPASVAGEGRWGDARGRLGVLAGGSRTAAPRHRALRDVVAWSWELLADDERAAAEQAAVFAAGFTADAAGRVGIAEDALYALVDKSLLTADASRFRMLDTIREYGLERLAEREALVPARAAHAACYLAVAEEAEPRLRGEQQVAWLGRLAADRDNLLAALRYAVDSGDAETAVRIAAALGLFWAIHGAHAEAVDRIREVLAMPGRVPDQARARAAAGCMLNALVAGELAGVDSSLLGEPDSSEPTGAFVRALGALSSDGAADALSGLDPHLEHPDPWTRAMLWLARGMLRGAKGEPQRARDDLLRAVAGFREAGERWGLSLTLMSLASTQKTVDDPAEALPLLDEATRATRELGTHDEQLVWLLMARIEAGDRDGARVGLHHVVDYPASTRQQVLARLPLADLARADGDLVEARGQLELAPEHGEPAYRALRANSAGFLAAADGELTHARRCFAEARTLALEMPDLPMLAQVMVGMADVRHRGGDSDGAAELLGAAHALGGGSGSGNPDMARLTRSLAEHRAAYERGSALDLAGALAKVQGGGQRHRSAPGRATVRASLPSPVASPAW